MVILARWSKWLSRVGAFEDELLSLSDAQLRKRSLSLRYRIKSGEPTERVLPEAYALGREAARRTVGMRHYDVQIIGGIAMYRHAIAEMQTGEGKTVTAVLPIYLAALAGKGAHLATANDYLAKRDAEWMRPVYEMLGMTVGVVEAETSRPQRHAAYRCDVTYGTAKEFGFDFLRDRLILRQTLDGAAGLLGGGSEGDTSSDVVQREPYFVLVDEADSILIDEARTPLVISAADGQPKESAVALYHWAAEIANRKAGHFAETTHYEYDHEKRTVTLNGEGRRVVRALPKPETLDGSPLLDIYEHVERAIRVERDFVLDREYVVRDGEVVIVDEFTGRLGEGRKWRAGIHQAVEAQAGVEVTVETGQAARITVQDYFRRYQQLAGMTGTAVTSRRELKRIYGVRVAVVPTNRPAVRERLTDTVFPDAESKWRAIVEDVRQVHATGRPILIGTRSIDKSERLSYLLSEAEIPHQVLNARHVAEEAEIISHAGEQGHVTVATNMAGRGTDIRLGEGVIELGGLYVICTEMHDSARIDRQLIGRCGRQGDPGAFRQYLALDDDILLEGWGPKKAARLRRRVLNEETGSANASLVSLFRKAQQKVERHHYRQRKLLMHHERERETTQREMGLDPYLDTPG